MVPIMFVVSVTYISVARLERGGWEMEWEMEQAGREEVWGRWSWVQIQLWELDTLESPFPCR